MDYLTTNELAKIWKENCPDWRFGQLMYNFQATMAREGRDIFFMEEAEFVQRLREYVDQFKL